MSKLFLKYTFMAIGGYLAVYYATGTGHLLDSASKAYNSGVKTLQARG